MQNRQRLVYRVLQEGWSLTAAAREAGVSRPTAYRWVKRAQEVGITALQEQSRRPHQLRAVTAPEVQQRVLTMKQCFPHYGAKKLHALLWPPPAHAPLCVRTVDRLLQRQGLVKPRPETQRPAQWQRFERSQCNELWQLDFKGLERCWGYYPLSILDDSSRFCLALEPLVSRETEAVWAVLWRVFGEYGMPDCILCDNGDGFNSLSSQGPTLFQARLWRLGLKTVHGRPRHPQTQGKVERFHRTLEEQWAQELRQPSVAQAQHCWPQVRQIYNWQRPHEALGQQMPGVCYERSSRPRPAQLPAAVVPPGAILRKVDAAGKLSYRNQSYRAGRGLSGEYVEIREEAELWLLYSDVRIAPLAALKV
jgi:transposase InsO family protein